MASYVAQGGSVFAVATRITALDVNGFPAAGLNSFTTSTLIKATLTPVVETGDDIAIKNAAGDLVTVAKHGDMVKYVTVALELALPDPQLEQILAGGTVLNDNGTALGVPTGLAATAQTTLGTLATGVYGYRATQYNAYGESLAEAEVTASVTGATGSVLLTGVTPAAGAIGVRYYGRTPGLEQYLGSQAVFGSQATSAASGTGTVTSLSVTALTKPLQVGTTFTITGDTNSPKIVFTVAATAGVGATTVSVTTSSTVTTTIAGAALVPAFLDTGAISPLGALPLSDLTAGPGNAAGYQASQLLPVGNPQGVSIELFSKRYKGGVWASDYPYYRTVVPAVKNLHVMPRDYTNANLQSMFEGQAFENPNWGSGPFLDWQFDSTKWFQRAVCGAQILPVAGVAPILSPA